LSSP